MTSQRVRALVAVLLTVGGAVMLTVVAIGRLPRGLITLVIVVLAVSIGAGQTTGSRGRCRAR